MRGGRSCDPVMGTEGANCCIFMDPREGLSNQQVDYPLWKAQGGSLCR